MRHRTGWVVLALFVGSTAVAQDAGPGARWRTGTARAVQVAVGPRHTCARMGDGSLRCWGQNDYGQLGDGTREARPRPIPASAVSGAVVDVQAGSDFTCARRANGTVDCWGYNRYGELGGGAAGERRETPAPVVRVRGASALRVGTSTACAIVGGQLHCWGRLEPDWDRANPVPRFLRSRPPIVAASVDDFACVVGQDRSLWCWGANHRPRPTAMGLTGVTDVVQGGLGACALRDDGTVHCWGWNDSGQLGRAFERERDTAYTNRPVAIPGISGARRVVAGGSHRCALLGNGTVQCWGAEWANPAFPSDCLVTTRHSSGGGSARQWRYCPTPTAIPGLRDVVDLDAHDTRTCAVTRAGAVWCWGNGESLASLTP